MLRKQDASHFSLTRKQVFLIKGFFEDVSILGKQEVDNVIY